jgi:hypothetical protein
LALGSSVVPDEIRDRAGVLVSCRRNEERAALDKVFGARSVRRDGKRKRAAALSALRSNRNVIARSEATRRSRAVRRRTTPGLLRFARNDDRGSTQTQFALDKKPRGKNWKPAWKRPSEVRI